MNPQPAQHPTPEQLSSFFDGELDRNERLRVEAHLQDCATCRTTLEDFDALASAGRDEVPPVPAGLAARIAVRAQPAAPEHPRVPRSRSWLRPAVLGAAATVVVGVLIGVAVRERPVGPGETKPESTLRPAAPPETGLLEQTRPGDEQRAYGAGEKGASNMAGPERAAGPEKPNRGHRKPELPASPPIASGAKPAPPSPDSGQPDVPAAPQQSAADSRVAGATPTVQAETAPPQPQRAIPAPLPRIRSDGVELSASETAAPELQYVELPAGAEKDIGILVLPPSGSVPDDGVLLQRGNEVRRIRPLFRADWPTGSAAQAINDLESIVVSLGGAVGAPLGRSDLRTVWVPARKMPVLLNWLTARGAAGLPDAGQVGSQPGHVMLQLHLTAPRR